MDVNKKEYGSEGMAHFAKKVEFLDNPEKRGDIPPEQLLRMVPVDTKDTILDLGAGTGYITIPAARMVEGLVYALDIDAKMLDFVNTKAKKENITNIKTVKGSINNIPLLTYAVDIALASIVLHEVQDLSASLNEIKRVLKPGGYFVCVEFEKKEKESDKHPRISSSLMEQEIRNTGFEVIQKMKPTDDLYIIIAKK
ncbi:class I SAM-dependent methyltransferase [Gracilibacillus suaedae]|uniref:class I SAM-dependent methyltransferase n=1 Tax=Gracilibacillus suaedae TaxID=2820273 RepID=UPI001ABDEAC4|nr:class I SAM-dependent methyltransferase [Gracilibacillus suaedae]